MPFTVTFSESVTGFEDSDVTVINGTVSSISGSGTTYTVNITPTADGTVSVQIPGSIATDSGGEHNSSSNLLQIEYMGSAPGAAITSTLDSLTNVSPVPIIATFSKAVTGFELGDLTITNGTASDFSGSGTTYTFNVTPAANGTVTVEIPTDICTDAAGNTNVPSSISLFYDTTSPSITITSPVTGDSLKIGSSKTISWQASDNHGVSKVDISHTIDNGTNWSNLILAQEDTSSFIWSIPNTPSEEVQLRFITTDVIGYIDTSYIQNLSIVIEYPKVVAVYPEGNKLTWKDTELIVQFSPLLDNTTITSDNVTLSAVRSTFTDSLIYDDNGLLTISLSNTLSALDTLTLTLKSGIT
ncbi:MAG: Ig-like domain-containing protein, partial [Anaerolineales bacterium]|nr:Ig-like domain-containing protein [Anaerolineales bacterium]